MSSTGNGDGHIYCIGGNLVFENAVEIYLGSCYRVAGMPGSRNLRRRSCQLSSGRAGNGDELLLHGNCAGRRCGCAQIICDRCPHSISAGNFVLMRSAGT